MDLKVLILDDEQRIIHELSEFLLRKGFQVKAANTPSAGFKMLDSEVFDVLILDVRLPEMDGLDVLKRVKADYPSMEVIMISGHGDMDTVIEALRCGASDYLKKPFRQTELMIALERTAKFIHLQRNLNQLSNENSLITKELERRVEKNFIGESKVIRKLLADTIHIASFTDTPIIIHGESGTGKEIIARIIHYASPRKDKKFCPINCAAMPESLMESEFFGYKKGTFTGAMQDKKGLLELSAGGTIFLDEIADMPPALQSKLLRVLEEKKIMKIGTNQEIAVDVRFIAATNKDLTGLIKEDRFRSDLFYRLSAYQLNIPPLRERTEDIEPLIIYFVEMFCQRNGIPVPQIDPILLKEIVNYPFPGNVRELKNLVERALIINRGGTLTMDDFSMCVTEDSSIDSKLDQLQIEQIKKALIESDHNQTQAAKLLGISRFALIRKIQKYGIV
ncbi:MAG: sigma-54 dependent transcriptional regulator [Candidatus Cloacimonetes bacterium]|nr:sigma-54 dependent transcriptional regulator [Candidatus Cloacimonadota bacterium]MDD3235169.1 sigma-54 dependent transcriptional regulator [Candidatus Cloacimonadota bacterium]